MKQKPPVFRTLDASLYKRIAGQYRGRLPGHVIVDIDRRKDENGRATVALRCKQPEVAKRVLADILGEEYVEPTLSYADLEEERPREWWQRSMDMAFGGSKRGNSGEVQKGIHSYGKRFQMDAMRVKRRMFPGEFPEEEGSSGSRSFSSSNERSYTENRGSGDEDDQGFIKTFQDDSGGYAKAFHDDVDKRAKAFKSDINDIRRRMYGPDQWMGEMGPTPEEKEHETGEEAEESVKVKSRRRGRGEWWQRSMGYGNRGPWGYAHRRK